MLRWMRSVAAVTLAAALVAGAGPAAFADKGKDGKDGQSEGRGAEHEHFVRVTGFFDLSPTDDWAAPYITQLFLSGMAKGDGHGRFNPKASISEAEAVTMVVRTVYGGDAQAQAQAAEKVAAAMPSVAPPVVGPGKGKGEAGSVYAAYLQTHTDWNVESLTHSAPWSLPYVALAVYDGLLDGHEPFQANRAASREWATELLVKGFVATGVLQADAVAHPDLTVLNRFKDAGQLTVAAQPYVAAAVAAGIVDGYPDHTFRPQAAISRAEFAAILARSSDQAGPTGAAVRGTVVSVDPAARKLTVTPDDDGNASAATYVVDANALIYIRVGGRVVNGAAGALSLADIQPGDEVSLYLDAQGEVALIYDRFELDDVSGTITTVHLATSTGDATTFTLKDADGQSHDFTLAPYGHIYLKGAEVSLTLLTEGSAATVQYHGTEAVTVRLGASGGEDEGGQQGDHSAGTTSLTGTVHDVIAQNAFTIDVVSSSDEHATVSFVYTVQTSAETEFEGVDGVAQLTPGEKVKVEGTVENFVIQATKVEAEEGD